MSEFDAILRDHQRLYTALASSEPPLLDVVRGYIEDALRISPEITYLEDRHELGRILRFWGSYLSMHGEEGDFPDIDIDHPSRRPTEIRLRPLFETHGKERGQREERLAFQDTESETDINKTDTWEREKPVSSANRGEFPQREREVSLPYKEVYEATIGDKWQDTFEEFYSYFNQNQRSQIINGFSRRYGLSADEMEEVINQTLVDIYSRWDSINVPPFAYFRKALLYKVHRFTRQKTKEREGLDIYQMQSSFDSIESEVNEETRQILSNILDKAESILTDREKTIFVQHFIESRSLGEIARDIGASRSYVHRYASSIREKIRALLKGQ